MTPDAHQLGKYRVLAELGRGGFATVYQALDTTLNRQVALKVLDPLLMRDTAWVERFQREARAVAALDHPHIVTIYEIAEADGRLYIAMKLIQGPSLAQRLAERGALPWEDALRIVSEVASALDYAHGCGVLHRDLKPANVLLGTWGAVLTDFGFAKWLGESSLSTSLSGGIVGTPAYVAPELWHGRPAGPASDIYALGCIVYEMLTGQQAFRGETPPAVMMAHFQPLRMPERWAEGTPAGIEEALRKALAQEPAERYGSAGEFLAALTQPPTSPPFPLVGEEKEGGEGVRAASAPAERMIWEKDGKEMVRVPAGEFLYGDKKKRRELPEFWIDKTPVTNAEYARFVAETGHEAPAHWKGKVPPAAIAAHPVVKVSWYDAVAYAQWAGKRLPTEAEWEKAARGTDGREYPWGNEEPTRERCNFGKNEKGTTPVGKYSPQGDSPYGCVDMAGNVWEWTASSLSLLGKVVRGGSWSSAPRYVRAAGRYRSDPDARYDILGFRCARS